MMMKKKKKSGNENQIVQTQVVSATNNRDSAEGVGTALNEKT
jgi:hypothetical protein